MASIKNKTTLKNRLKLLFVFAIALGSNLRSNAQDIHYSQHWASPLYANPAQTGYFSGDWRLAGIYRNQWKAISGKAYNSAGISYDRQDFYYSEQINSGILVVADHSGTDPITRTKAYLTASYLKKLNGHTFAFGIQPGIVNLSTDLSSINYDSQYDLGNPNGVFNSNLSNNEGTLESSNTNFDLNAGVLWSKKVNAKWRPQVGLSMHHLTVPNESLTGIKSSDTRVPLKTMLHVGAEYYLNSVFTLCPKGMYSMQRGAREMIVGGNAEMRLQNNVIKSVYAGSHFRYGMAQNYDASIWLIGTKFLNFDAAVSYDINVSALSEATSNRGALEISLIYISGSTKPTKIKIPCDRL